MITIKGLTDAQTKIAYEILHSNDKFHTIKASRQSGKTYLLSHLAFMFGLYIKDNILVVSPTYSQVRLIYDNMLKIKNSKYFISEKRESAPFHIKLKTGSTITFKSADRPDMLRGGSNQIVLIDEFAFTKDNLLEEVIRPTTAAKKGSKIILSSTPKGTENAFYDYYKNGEQGMHNYKSYSFSYKDNPYYDLNEIENAKLSLPNNIYLQEYEAEFIETNGDVFGDFSKVMTIAQFSNIIPIKCYAGIDFGRANDDTVLTILNEKREVIFMSEFKGDWPVIIDELSIILNKYRPITYAESNGVGDPVISLLLTKYKNIIPFFQTNETNNQLVEKLLLDINKEAISLPDINLLPKLTNQMNTFSYTLTKTGKISYHHKPSYHDDYLFSLMLANKCLDDNSKGFRIIPGQINSFRN